MGQLTTYESWEPILHGSGGLMAPIDIQFGPQMIGSDEIGPFKRVKKRPTSLGREVFNKWSEIIQKKKDGRK